MDVVFDQAGARAWYAKVPADYRDLDVNGELYAYLRIAGGDVTGGVNLSVDVLAGRGYFRPILLSNGSSIRLGGLAVLIDDAVIDPVTGGVFIPLDTPVTTLDPLNDLIVLITTGDWVLTDIATVPEEWLPWLSLMIGVDLRPCPRSRWREWLADPVSRAPGTLLSIIAATKWHAADLAAPTAVKSGARQITVTVPAAQITTSEDELEAMLDRWFIPAGTTLVLSTP